MPQIPVLQTAARILLAGLRTAVKCVALSIQFSQICRHLFVKIPDGIMPVNAVVHKSAVLHIF
jgi:hypothetical protein